MRKFLFIFLLFALACKDKVDSKQASSDFNDQIEMNEKKRLAVKLVQEFKSKNPNTTVEDTLVLKSDFGYFEIEPTGLLKINHHDTVQLNTKLIVKKAFIHKDSTHYYLYFTDTDYDGATSWIQKIDITNRNTDFTEQIQGFNLGHPVVRYNKAYVSAIGFIGKIDLTTGKYDWKHNNLYDTEKFAFNNFDTIQFNHGQVAFISENYRSQDNNSVLVDDSTGKIIAIDK